LRPAWHCQLALKAVPSVGKGEFRVASGDGKRAKRWKRHWAKGGGKVLAREKCADVGAGPEANLGKLGEWLVGGRKGT
jgi:hypothetical protein